MSLSLGAALEGLIDGQGPRLQPEPQETQSPAAWTSEEEAALGRLPLPQAGLAVPVLQCGRLCECMSFISFYNSQALWPQE